MKLKAVLDSLEGLDAKYHELYSENSDGTFELQIDGIKQHPTVVGLSSAFGRTKSALSDAKSKADKWDELVELRGDDDLSPDTIHDALEAKPSGDIDEDVQKRIDEAERRGAERAEAKAKRETDKLEATNQRLDTALRGRTVHGDLDEAIAKAGVKESLRPAARAFLLQKDPQMIEDEGDFRGVFKQDPDGIPRDLSVSDFVEQWIKTDEAAPFLPATPGGSGAGDSRGGGPVGSGQIDGSDPLAWGENADKIASGEMTVS